MKSKKIIIIFSILLIIILIGGYFTIKYVKEKNKVKIQNQKNTYLKRKYQRSN